MASGRFSSNSVSLTLREQITNKLFCVNLIRKSSRSRKLYREIMPPVIQRNFRRLRRRISKIIGCKEGAHFQTVIKDGT